MSNFRGPPHFAQDGFSEDFLRTENTLLGRDKNGGLCRDRDGNVSLECTCGLVISGKTDPPDPLFTKGGSSWTNDSFFLLELPPDQDPRTNPRNNCIHQGYASVALIPVRTQDRIVGLIQLNDKRRDRFTVETIEILESIASHIGSALMRKQAEDNLRESEERFRTMVNSMEEVIFTLDDQMRHTGVFGPWVDKMGLTPEYFLGKTAREVFGYAGAEVHEEANKRALGGEFVLYDWKIKGETGIKYFQTSLSPLRDEAGKVTGIIGIDGI